jgi:hypothetical protein
MGTDFKIAGLKLFFQKDLSEFHLCKSVASAVKSKKKKVAFPRRTWQINPVTRVKGSARKYSRSHAKQNLRKQDE